MKKKKEDPKRLRLRAAKDAADLRYSILLHGVAAELPMFDHYPEGLTHLVQFVNEDLLTAAKVAAEATEAYRPYWGRRTRYVPKKKAK